MSDNSDPDPGPTRTARGWVPVPDPTDRTVADLRREIDAVKERMAHDDGNLRELVYAKVDANTSDIRHLRGKLEELPIAMATAVARLQELHEEKFRSIEIQFKERDVRTDQTSRDSKVAVDAALKAQQEAFSEQNKSSALAISKSEASTTKQIDQIGTNIALLAKAIDDKVADIKDRLTKIESVALGVITQKTETAQVNTGSSQNWGIVGIVIGALVGAIGIAVAILKP